jgi:hypothetical protein
MHEIEKLCSKDSNIGFGLIAQLVGKYGNQKFDKAIRTKMIDTLLANMDAAGIKSYLAFLTKCFLTPDERYVPRITLSHSLIPCYLTTIPSTATLILHVLKVKEAGLLTRWLD